MSFKEVVEDDIIDIFLDDYEFADEHEIGGNLTKAVVDTDNLVRLKGSDIIGTTEADMIIFAKTSDLPKILKNGSVLNVDGNEMTITDIRKAMGMTELSLKTYVGY